MAYEKCPFTNEECKFYEAKSVIKGERTGCRSNEHHLYGRARAKELGGIAVQFAQLERNRVQLCEALHGELEAVYGWLEFPPVAVMKAIIEADHGK